MQIKTWLHRLTDESNLWFSAVKAEDDGELGIAVLHYLKDALECTMQNSHVRSALSCSCAAGCLEQLGASEKAKMLYTEAAMIYTENSEVAMSESIRESLWSLQQAFENFLLAGKDEAAEIVRDRYLALAARTNPFQKPEQVRQEFEKRKALIKSEILTKGSNHKSRQEIPKQVDEAIEDYLRARSHKAKRARKNLDRNDVQKLIDPKGGSRLSEKSLAS